MTRWERLGVYVGLAAVMVDSAKEQGDDLLMLCGVLYLLGGIGALLEIVGKALSRKESQ